MSTPINNGGPAFPGPYDYRQDGSPVWGGDRGMTLRDWFAGQAIAGLAVDERSSAMIAGWAYDIADAMLAAREGKR